MRPHPQCVRCRPAVACSTQPAVVQPFRTTAPRLHAQCKAFKQLDERMRAESHDQQQGLSRRQALAVMGAFIGLIPNSANAQPSTDLIEGTENLLRLGVESYSLWAQELVEEITNDDQTGLVQPEPQKRHFAGVSIPGLSSFSFIHGTLVGGTLILLLSLIGNKGQQQEQVQQPVVVEQPVLRPEVEAALRRLLASPDISSTFHDPAVHAAIQDVRGDLRNITKYKDDPAVMQAFQKLLEIEDILERL